MKTLHSFVASYIMPVKKNLSDLEKVKIIREVICNYYKIELNEFEDASRKRIYVIPRQVFAAFAKKNTELTLGKIGLEMGGKDHATTLHSIRKWTELTDVYSRYQKEELELQKLIDEKFNFNSYQNEGLSEDKRTVKDFVFIK